MIVRDYNRADPKLACFRSRAAVSFESLYSWLDTAASRGSRSKAGFPCVVVPPARDRQTCWRAFFQTRRDIGQRSDRACCARASLGGRRSSSQAMRRWKICPLSKMVTIDTPPGG